MPNNLFISYDLYAPTQNYEAVARAIKSLGTSAKVQKSLWYVRSLHSAQVAAQHVRKAMDANDSLIVIDATNNDACWYKVTTEAENVIQQNWRRIAA